MKLDQKRVRKILLVRNDRIGDVVTSSGFITGLQNAYPHAKIDFVGSKLNKALIEKHPTVRKVYVADFSPRNFKDLWNYFRISRKLRKERYDLGIDFRGGF